MAFVPVVMIVILHLWLVIVPQCGRDIHVTLPVFQWLAALFQSLARDGTNVEICEMHKVMLNSYTAQSFEVKKTVQGMTPDVASRRNYIHEVFIAFPM